MPVKEVPKKYATPDGREFDTKKEAERHEALIKARETYMEARLTFARCLAQTQRTADGKIFDFSQWGDYYYIAQRWSSLPELLRVHFYGWSIDLNDQDEGVIRHQVGDKWIEYRISELYADKEIAEKALVKAQEKRLADYTQQIAELKAKVYPRHE